MLRSMPTKDPDRIETTVRLPRALVEAIDEQRQHTGLTRNAMIAVLLREAIDQRR